MLSVDVAGRVDVLGTVMVGTVQTTQPDFRIQICLSESNRNGVEVFFFSTFQGSNFNPVPPMEVLTRKVIVVGFFLACEDFWGWFNKLFPANTPLTGSHGL